MDSRKRKHTDSPSQQDSAPSTSSIPPRTESLTEPETEQPKQGSSPGMDSAPSTSSIPPRTESLTEPETEQPQQGSYYRMAGAAPEDIWKPFIQDLYPNLLRQTHFVPPIHFNRTPQDVATIAGQTVSVRDNPPSIKGYRKLPPPPPPAQVAGTVFIGNLPNIHPVHAQFSDQQDDKDQQRCLQALSTITKQVMMVISSLEFKRYLSNHPNPRYAAAIAQLPSIQHPSIPANIADGECDIVIIHRQYGLIIGEVKSVGGSPYFCSQTPGDQTQLIIKHIEKALKQLNNQETALRHLVSDLPPIRITKTLLLPNISSGQLQSALSACLPLLQELWRTLSLPTSLPADVSRAASHCMCQEDVEQPDTWWQTIHGSGQDGNMSDDVYQRLVARPVRSEVQCLNLLATATVDADDKSPNQQPVTKIPDCLKQSQVTGQSEHQEKMEEKIKQHDNQTKRFCGPATAVEVPTAGPRRKVVRSLGEAVSETGLRFSSLTLTPRQVALLNTQPEPQYMYLQGPPGTGKTVVLLLKALQWVQQGRQVVIVSGGDGSRAVTVLLEEQLRSMAGPAAASLIQRLCYHLDDFWQHQFDARAAVASLQQHTVPDPVWVICDEFNLDGGEFIPWMREVHDQLPAASVWAAGIWRVDGPRREPLRNPRPSWLQVETLQEALRCPPSVTTLLQQSSYIQVNDVPQYTDPQVAVATQGPPVQRLQHRHQPGHSGDQPWQCVACADMAAQFFHQLRVGQPGQPLQYRDVWILYDAAAPCADDVIVRRLQQQHGLPVGVASYPPSEADARELALAVRDQIMVTEWAVVQGLERRVVIVLGTADQYSRLPSWSRCSSLLYIIE